MIFKIRDGREYFYQWDIDRELLVLDPTVNEVHFCNRTDDCSLVVEVKEIDIFADGKLLRTERFAPVPNILLQDNWKIKAYAFCGDCYTKIEQTFNVKSRTKPADYVYTETEVLTYSQLEKRLDEIEQNGFSEDVINAAVEDYLEKNPIEVPELDLTGYATEQYVQTEIGKIDIPEVPSLDGYATEKYVDDAIANLDIPEPSVDVDLSNYYTKAEVYNKTEVDNKLSDISVDTEVQVTDDGNGNVTIEAAEGGGEVTPADLSNYYTKTETDALVSGVYVPTRVSELENDKNYLTNVPAEYITETELNAKGYVTSLAGYATEAYADALFDGANKAVAYNNYSEMITALSTAEKDAYKVGQNIMIVTLNVPDLWVSSVKSNKASYTYTNDASVIAEFDINGQLQIGYFVVAPLETQKVDLTEYTTEEDVNGLISNATAALVQNNVNEALTIDLSVNESAPITTYIYSNAITAITNLKTTLVEGFSVQFKTSSTISNNETSAYWVGDDTSEGTFTPTADTFYEVYSYYNSIKANVVNMVIKL